MMGRMVSFVVAAATMIGFAACRDDEFATDAAVVTTDAAVDAPDGPSGPCPGEFYLTGSYLEWDTMGGIPGVNAATWTVRGAPSRTDMTSPNGRVELCVVTTGASTIDVTEGTHLSAIYVADPAVFRPANSFFQAKGITTTRAGTFYTSLGATFDAQAGHVLVEKIGSPIQLTIGAGGTAFAVDNVDDNSWTAGNSGGLVLFANVPIAAQASLSSNTAFTGPTTLPLEAGKLTITTIR